MEHQQSNQLALFIDGENTKPDFEQLFSFCHSYGQIRVARIYGNRDLLRIPRWQKACNQFQLKPVYSEKGQKNRLFVKCCGLYRTEIFSVRFFMNKIL